MAAALAQASGRKAAKEAEKTSRATSAIIHPPSFHLSPKPRLEVE
jgi:hypothetical protein